VKSLIETILVVEDDESTRVMLENLLTLSGFRVFGAANGAEALRQISHHQPDAILLDLMLPGVSGVGVLATLREIPALKKTPVLVITGTNTGAFELRTFAPVTVMRKPLNVDAVVPCIQDLLSRRFPT
jgi:DNA-binding response OmpR family regulator